MFLRRRALRKLAIPQSHVSSSSRASGSGFWHYRSPSPQVSKLSLSSSSNAQAMSLTGPSSGSALRSGAPLQHLKDRELLSIIRRTVEARKEVPASKRRDPGTGYSRAAGMTYTSVYLELRRRGAQSLMTTCPEVFVYIAEHCVFTGEMKVLDSVVEDSIELADLVREGKGDEEVERHHRAMENVLKVLASSHIPRPPGPIPLQQHINVLDLFKALLLDQQPSRTRPNLTFDCLDGVLKSVISLSADWHRITPLLEPLLRCVRNMPARKVVYDPKSKGSESLTAEQSVESILSRLHRLVHLMVTNGLHSLSFGFLEALLRNGFIPSRVIRQSDSELDFHNFMVSVLLRWSAYYGWPDRALQVLRIEDPTGKKRQAEYLLNAELEAGYLANTKLYTGFVSGEERVQAEEFSKTRLATDAVMSTKEQEHYSTLVNDLFSSFLIADASKLTRCSQIVGLMLSRFPTIRLNNALIHTFFKTAREMNATSAAELMYVTLRSTCDFDQYINGLLHGGVLPWLLGHLVHQKKNLKLARLLVQDIIRSPNEVSLYERGDVIAICAAGGNVAETRSLWERYAVGPGNKMVTGHTRCMVGIVKLFKGISDMTAKNSREVEDGERDMSGTKETKLRDVAASNLSNYSSDQGAQSCCFGTTASLTVLRQTSSGKNPTVPSFRAGTSVKRDDSDGMNTIPETDDLELEITDAWKTRSASQHDITETILAPTDVERPGRYDVSEPVTRNPGVSDEPEPDEYIVFAHKVLDAYRRAKEPLHRASHHDLNALARASDMLGSVRQSMQALQTVVDRKEIPDTHDMNVVMIAMAARDPMRAEEMLGLMLQEGMHLNILTFTAVIFGWLKKGNTKRASRVYSRAMRAGHAKLTADVGTGLLIALVDSCCSSEGTAVGQVPTDDWMHRTFLRQAYSLIKTESYRNSAIPYDFGERCVGAALRLEEVGLALYFWKQLLETTTLYETGQQRELRHGIARLVAKATAKGTIGVEERDRMIAELGSGGFEGV
ncbi:hypothetical protein ACEPAI_9175 [Sanghuangporus weigelae]